MESRPRRDSFRVVIYITSLGLILMESEVTLVIFSQLAYRVGYNTSGVDDKSLVISKI